MDVALATSRDVDAVDADEHLLAAALGAAGHRAPVLPWDDDETAWGSFDGVIVRSTWDYDRRLDEFLDWTRRVEQSGATLLNSAEVIAWNSHKGYLAELEERGAPIVPTAWLGQGDQIELAELAASRGWDEVVAKPAVGAGARGLLVARTRDEQRAAQEPFAALTEAGDALVQRYVPSVSRGEVSVTVLAGTATHAVRKTPAAGESRVQIEFGGSYEVEAMDDDTARLAEWLVEATGHDLLYARADLLADDDGSWMVGELEVIEPALHLAWAPGSAERMAGAAVRRLRGGSGEGATDGGGPDGPATANPR